MPASIARIELRKPILQDASDWYSTMHQPETIPYLYDGFCDLDEAGLRAQFSMPLRRRACLEAAGRSRGSTHAGSDP